MPVAPREFNRFCWAIWGHMLFDQLINLLGSCPPGPPLARKTKPLTKLLHTKRVQPVKCLHYKRHPFLSYALLRTLFVGDLTSADV